LYATNVNNPDWHVDVLSVEQTRRDWPGGRGGRDSSLAAIEGDKRGGIAQGLIQQENYLSWDAAIPGAYYANEFRAVDQERRLTRCPYDPSYPVYACWDLGIDDYTAIWCVQFIGRSVCCLHYYENHGFGAEHYGKYLAALPYQGNYRGHLLPHDGHNRDWGTGETREAVLQRLVQGVVCSVQRNSLVTGIDNVRTLFPRLVFDADGCKDGIAALRDYKHEWDEVKKVFAPHPEHDWASHGADALRTLANGLAVVAEMEEQFRLREAPPPPRVPMVLPYGRPSTAWMG